MWRDSYGNSANSNIALKPRPEGESCRHEGVADLNSAVPRPLVHTLKRQRYHLIGKHSAVKRCRWLHEALVNNRPCYKQKFYGIKTHQCVQMTPSVYYCTQHCTFCWRAQSGDLGLTWNELDLPNWDMPEELVEQSLDAQRAIVSGYKANARTDKFKYREALKPRQAAISLAGEPTLYPYLSELLQSFHRRGFTTFLVSNGTVPGALAKLAQEPSQLYISVCAPDRKTFIKTCQPQIPNAWENLQETLGALRSFQCPTVIRMTLASGMNMKNVNDYARIIEKSQPSYVEAKAYMHVGYSRLRMRFDNTPSHQEIRDFSEELAGQTGYTFISEAEESRVVLLSRLEKPQQFT